MDATSALSRLRVTRRGARWNCSERRLWRFSELPTPQKRHNLLGAQRTRRWRFATNRNPGRLQFGLQEVESSVRIVGDSDIGTTCEEMTPDAGPHGTLALLDAADSCH